MTIFKKAIILCLLAAAISIAQKQRVAVLPTMASPGVKITPQELDLLMERVRMHASDVLPLSGFTLLRQDFVMEQLGDESFFRACKEGACVGELMAKVNADFGARCEISIADSKLRLKFELYGTMKGESDAGTISTFTEEAKNFKAMETLIDQKVPDAFRKILGISKAAPPIYMPVPPISDGDSLIDPRTVIKGAFTDARDGKRYRTVKIGKQTWMAENLNYNASGSSCYENNTANCAKYGRLYNWQTALKACPSGWHLPGNSEWELLDKSVGGDMVAGKKLKAKSGWDASGNGTDDYSFSAMPGGRSYSNNNFEYAGNSGILWSATENSSDTSHKRNSEKGPNPAYARLIHYDYDKLLWYSNDKTHLYSIRCIKNTGF